LLIMSKNVEIKTLYLKELRTLEVRAFVYRENLCL
jgi:hypothetical protein